MFWMCEQTVRTAAISRLMPNHFSTMIVLLLGMVISTCKCRKSRRRTPRGPLTATFLAFILTSTAKKLLFSNDINHVLIMTPRRCDCIFSQSPIVASIYWKFIEKLLLPVMPAGTGRNNAMRD